MNIGISKTNKKPWFEAKSIEAWIDGKKIFDNLTLELFKGESTVILGPNGSGKSSLLKIINRSLYPVIKKGSSLLLFQNKQIDIIKLRSLIGVVLNEQDKRINPTKTGLNLILSAFFGSFELRGHQKPQKEHEKRAEEILNELSLKEISNKPYFELSDGQRRRMLIGRALVHKPEILILDEPTIGLDIKSKHDLTSSLKQIVLNGTTVILVTHQIETVFKGIDRVIFMKNGKIIEDGKIKEQMTEDKLSNLFKTPLRLFEYNNCFQVLPK